MDAELTRTVRAAMPYAETLGLELLAASPDEVPPGSHAESG